MRCCSLKQNNQQGFTLVELLAVAPIMILTISTLLVLVVNMTGSAMRSGARSQLQNDVLVALDQIEQDVRLGISLKKNGNDFLIQSLATSKNPYSPDRQLIIREGCKIANSGVYIDAAATYRLKYQINSNRLERVILHDEDRGDTETNTCLTSGNVWQNKNTTEALIKDADITMNINLLPASSSNPHTAKITLTAKRVIAGVDVEYRGVMHARSINI